MSTLTEYLWADPEPRYMLFESPFLTPRGLKIFRHGALLIMTAIYIYSFLLQGGFAQLEYLTLWGVNYVFAYFVAINTCYFVYKDESEPLGKIWRVTQILFTMAFSLQTVIPPLFWIVLYPGLPEDHSGEPLFNTICIHAITGTMIWIEMGLNRVPIYMKYLPILIGFTMIYMLINFLVTTISGTPVYFVITWNNFGTVIYLAVSLAVEVLGFTLGIYLTKKKNAVRQKEKQSRSVLSESFN